MGLVMLFFWLLFAGSNMPFETINELDGDIEMFFLSGVTMVIAATFVLVYNADLLLGLLTLVGGLVLVARAVDQDGGGVSAGEQVPHRHDDRDDLARHVRAGDDVAR